MLNPFAKKDNTRAERVKRLRELFEAQMDEFTEDNLNTNIVTFFEDVLESLPMPSRQVDVEALFKEAFDE